MRALAALLQHGMSFLPLIGTHVCCRQLLERRDGEACDGCSQEWPLQQRQAFWRMVGDGMGSGMMGGRG